MLSQQDIANVLSGYDHLKIRVGAIASHSALDIFDGAIEEGFPTVAYAQRGRELTYGKYFASRRASTGRVSRGIVDRTLILDRFDEILDEEFQHRMRERNVILIPNRSLTSYVDLAAIESNLRVPLFGSRSMLRIEDRGEEGDYYDLLAKGGLPTPERVEPKDIDQLCIVKLHHAQKPLERGFGITIGNALRRILLTSIPGAAITHVKIDGVQHEFSTLSGVKEDVADIIMNLKNVRFKLMDNNPDKVNLSIKGKHIFTANDIQKASDQFEILNPEQYISEINSKGKIDMELRIGIGKGYVPSEENDLPNLTVGTLSIDSIFNPVTNASFSVQPVPGAKEPIEILKMEVTTDGSITAKDASSYSATYLREHLKFVEAISNPSVLEISDGVSEETIMLRKLLNSTIDEMELSVRSFNCLQAAGIKYIHELVNKEENQMLKYKNFGRKSLTELVEKLDSMGLHFGMEIEKILAEEG